jgi:ribosome-binding factor A
VSSRRLLKAAEAVREVVSMAILTQVRDPRVRDVTVTRVEMAPDMRSATVHVSVMGSPAQEALALRGLASSAGFLQSQIAERIETRYTPRLRFEIDSGVKRSIEMARLLADVLPADAPAAESADGSEGAVDGGGDRPSGDIAAGTGRASTDQPPATEHDQP